jgi:hypothetical protein
MEVPSLDLDQVKEHPRDACRSLETNPGEVGDELVIGQLGEFHDAALSTIQATDAFI